MLEQLQEFVELSCTDRDFAKKDSVKSFLQGINDTHVFKVDLQGINYKDLDGIRMEGTDWLSLPFANNFIIVEGGLITSTVDADVLTTEFLGFSVQEISPDYIRVVSIAEIGLNDEEKYLFPFSFSFIQGKYAFEVALGDSNTQGMYDTCVRLGIYILKQCMERINKQVFTLVENEDKIDFKTRALGGYSRLKIKPSYIIYLGTEKSLLKSHPDLSSKILRNKPEFSWAVRGHWRRLSNPDSIGKDRSGDYKVKAFTWVSDYIKGEGELVKKIRVAK